MLAKINIVLQGTNKIKIKAINVKALHEILNPQNQKNNNEMQ